MCEQISGLCELFSPKRVCCHCGACHNAEMDLYGTVCRCSNRLRAIDTIIPLHSERPRYSLPIPAKFLFVAFLNELSDIARFDLSYIILELVKRLHTKRHILIHIAECAFVVSAALRHGYKHSVRLYRRTVDVFILLPHFLCFTFL